MFSFVQLSEQHGLNTYLHFIRRLIVHSQARLTSTQAPSAFDTSTSLTFRLLVQEMQRLARDPFLADRFREGVDKGEGEIFRTFDLVRFADRVGLRPLERLVLAASIVAAGVAQPPTSAATVSAGGAAAGAQTQGAVGVKKALADQAATIIRVDFENAALAMCQHPSFDHADLSLAQAGKLLQNLLSDPPLDAPILDATQRQALIAAAHTKYGHDAVLPILQQLLPKMRYVLCSYHRGTHHSVDISVLYFMLHSLPPGTTLVQCLIQLGADITNDVEVARALLARFGINEQNPPKDFQVVEIFSTLGRHAADGVALCDVGVLVRAISNLVSHAASINPSIQCLIFLCLTEGSA